MSAIVPMASAYHEERNLEHSPMDKCLLVCSSEWSSFLVLRSQPEMADRRRPRIHCLEISGATVVDSCALRAADSHWNDDADGRQYVKGITRRLDIACAPSRLEFCSAVSFLALFERNKASVQMYCMGHRSRSREISMIPTAL